MASGAGEMGTGHKCMLSLALSALLVPCSVLLGQDGVEKNGRDPTGLSSEPAPRREFKADPLQAPQQNDGDMGTKPHGRLPGILKDKPVMAMAAAHGTLAFVDATQTERDWKLSRNTNGTFREQNPLLRPLVGHPAALYGYTAGGVVFSAWLGHKFRESRYPLLQKFWWVPQAAGIAGGSFGVAYTSVHYTRN